MKKLYFALVALMLCAVSAQAEKTIYIDPWQWSSDNANFAAWVWNTGDGKSYSMSKVDGTDYYSVTIPDDMTKIIFIRINSSNTTQYYAGGWPSEVWNQTEDIDLPTDGKNMYVFSSWSSPSGSWSTYTPPVVEVEKPTFSKEGSEFSEAFELTITAAEGATIYYTLNGEDPTTSSVEYTTPIQISETTTVKAIAVLNGVESAVKEATYTYFVLETAKLVVFVNNQKGWENLNFYAWSTHMSDIAGSWPGSAMSYITADDTRFPDDMAGTTWWQIRDLTVPANEDFNFILNNGTDQTGDQTGYNVSTNMEKGEDGTYYMYVILPAEGDTQTGVNEIAVDENAPVEYFNFQGVRVANPEKGMYIRVQGGKATKVIL